MSARTSELGCAPLPASSVPPAPNTELPEAEQHAHDLTFVFDARRCRVRGLDNNGSFDVLKINLPVGQRDAVHVDTLDL